MRNKINIMTHCTSNIGWYIGKFVLSVSAILFIYWGFLKEKDIICYCGAIERESHREPNKMENNSDKLQSRCICRHRRETIYPCGCERNIKKNIIGDKDKFENDNTHDDTKCNCSRK